MADGDIIAELVENFSLFDDWEERYRYLVELGQSLPPMRDEDKTEDTRVRGCTSQVWMRPLSRPGEPLDFAADSDAHIVRGLIGVLRIIYAGKTAAEVLAIDIRDIFARLGLEEHLSPSRRNGFYAMVTRIRQMAGEGLKQG